MVGLWKLEGCVFDVVHEGDVNDREGWDMPYFEPLHNSQGSGCVSARVWSRVFGMSRSRRATCVRL